ncbi:PTS transporter subunit IIC [Oceanivirga miroungae]|uniref:Phosphotransferase system EIIC domain-containing protein n=1 Tax=Oceanivirga miroungae TaxID=1130046 RepID=A0A6I8M7Q0_9FUSO|nr:PTS sugar transporter subunit IIC [Oceanivirga miroungae]VWL84850.1 hypothetical protein OMES3154_00104 [Oceanivirga miroungae]
MENQQLTTKKFIFKVLNGLSLGIVVSLIPNALLGELSKALIPTMPVFKTVLIITALAVSLLPVAIGIGVSMEFKLTPIQTASVAIATLVGSGVARFHEGAFLFKGTGDVVNAWLTVSIAVLIVLILGNKLKAYTILVIPAVVIVIAGGIGIFTLPYVQKITEAIGIFVLQVTTLQPLIMGALLAVIFAILIVSPISTVGIAIAISLSGIGSGAANLGITSTAIAFAIAGMKSNSLGVFVAHLMGSPKMQLANFIKKPIMMAPAVCTAFIVGIFGAILNINGTAFSAGFGISGLIGPVNALNLAKGGWTNINMLKVLFVFVILPFILAIIFDYVFKKVLKITSDDDYKLNFN